MCRLVTVIAIQTLDILLFLVWNGCYMDDGTSGDTCDSVPAIEYKGAYLPRWMSRWVRDSPLVNEYE